MTTAPSPAGQQTRRTSATFARPDGEQLQLDRVLPGRWLVAATTPKTNQSSPAAPIKGPGPGTGQTASRVMPANPGSSERRPCHRLVTSSSGEAAGLVTGGLTTSTPAGVSRLPGHAETMPSFRGCPKNWPSLGHTPGPRDVRLVQHAAVEG